MTESPATTPPRPVVIAGPSGAGKGTLIELLQKHFDDDDSHDAKDAEASRSNGYAKNQTKKFGFSVSHTTRKPRPGEVDGTHYNFTTVEEMKKEIEDGKFVEFAEVHGNYYGTSISAVKNVQSQNKICILDIDIQGVQNVKKNATAHFTANYIFIAPPSMEELEKRLRGRGTESEEAILKRLENAKGEMEFGTQEGNFDMVLVNDDLDGSLQKLVAKFKEWYPDLLGEDGNKVQRDGDEKQSTTSPTPLQTDENETIPPPVVDPLSFPQTDEGLASFLSEIDQDCPLEGYAQTELTFKATNVKVAAGKKLDIPLPPVQQNGSKIEWSVTLVDEHEEHLDINFGLVVIVDGEEVTAREMGRILSPTPYIKEDASAANNNDDATASTSASSKEGEHSSAKGKFTVSNSAPVTIVIKLDNSYSWFVPKKVNYSFTVIPPIDENMIQRSLRAKSVFGKLLEGKKAALEKKEKEAARTSALERIKSEMEGKLKELHGKKEDGRKSIEAIHKRSEEAQDEAKKAQTYIKEKLKLVKKEEETIDEVTSAIIALEEECARLKKKWEELNIEKSVREEEKAKFEKEADEQKQERMQLQEEISAKLAEEKEIQKSLEALEKDEELIKENLADLEKERKAREEEVVTFAEEIKFLQKQLDAVRLRFVEPKTSY